MILPSGTSCSAASAKRRNWAAAAVIKNCALHAKDICPWVALCLTQLFITATVARQCYTKTTSGGEHMFGFFDGLKMRLLALMAMLMAAAPATVATATVTPPPANAPKTLSAQTVTTTPAPTAPITPPKTTQTPVLTPVVPSPVTPAPEDPTPTPPKPTCGCAPYQLHKHIMCPMVCSDSQTQ